MRKPNMFRNFAAIYLFLVSSCAVSAGNPTAASEAETHPIVKEEQENNTKYLVENKLNEFMNLANMAINAKGTDLEVEANMSTLEELLELVSLMKDEKNVEQFIEAKGFDRVIVPYLRMDQTEIKAQLLKLTRLLFDKAHNTTSATIPIRVLDRVLDIFEEEDRQLKALSMDILYAWLPDNPKVQARLMKVKGLQPFYEQARELDLSTIQTLLKLFSKIIKEHIKARARGMKTEPSKINYYKNIGLIERLSSARISYGLFDIFQSIWEYGQNNKEFMVPVYEILVDIYPYCSDTLFGRPKTLELMSSIHEHVKRADENTKDFYEQLGLNTTNLEIVLEKYVKRLESKDEL